MLTRFIILSLSAFLLVGCKLHVNVSGLESDLVLVEKNSGATLTLVENGITSFNHEFSAFDYYDVEISEHSGQNCHLIYKSGRMTTSYSEMEVNCFPIASASCTADYQPLCTKVDSNLDCNEGEICLNKTYRTFPNQCTSETSSLNPVAIGLDECQLIEGTFVTDAPAAVFLNETPVKDEDINVISATFDGNYMTVTFEHDSNCAEDNYDLQINKFDVDATRAEWAIIYKRSPCATLVTQVITFDLNPLREWYYQQNGKDSGTINLAGIGEYSF